ncbi:MAG TPA: radical SAM protein, partial [bacterium]|nr:radical SAM protein [bacterium]
MRHSFGGVTAILNPYNLRWQYLTGDYVRLFDFFDEPRDFDEISRHLATVAGNPRTRGKLVGQIEGWADDGYIVPANFDEPSLMGWCRRFGSRSARLPSILYIFPTLSCNLRCRYCFIVGKGEKLPPSNLSLDKLEKAVDLVIYNLRRPIREGSRSSFTFLFYGGEPLLRRDFFFEAVKLIESKRRKFGKIKPRIGIITNGTMIDDEVASFIRRHRIDAGISLDGDRRTTDRARVYPDGRGAFADIMRGAKALKRHGVPFGLSVTVGKHNVDLLPDQIR